VPKACTAYWISAGSVRVTLLSSCGVPEGAAPADKSAIKFLLITNNTAYFTPHVNIKQVLVMKNINQDSAKIYI
jgi:hypothetical protein